MKYVMLGLVTFTGLLLLATLARGGAAASPPTGPVGTTPTSPPLRGTGGAATPSRPVVDPTRDTLFWCRQGNPSCQREAWWAEFDESPRTGSCQYSFLPPSFSTDCGLEEAVVNAALYPTGRSLLEEAAAWGVHITVVPQSTLPKNAIAVYENHGRRVRVGDQWNRVSTWMVSAVLVHELTHAHQDHHGQLDGSCLTVETPAYQAEIDYVRWLAARMGGLPARDDVAGRLSAEDQRLFGFLRDVLAVSDIRPVVAGICGRSHGVPEVTMDQRDW